MTTDSRDNNDLEQPLDAVSTRRSVQRNRGRSRSVMKRPRYRQADRLRWLQQQLDQHVEQDELVSTVRAHGSTGALINELSVALAEEAAGLLWERRRHAPGTREAERISSRRIKALADLAKLELVRARLGTDEIDPRDGGVQRIVELFIDKVEGVVRDVLPEETADRLLVAWKGSLVGWEDEAGAG